MDAFAPVDQRGKNCQRTLSNEGSRKRKRKKSSIGLKGKKKKVSYTCPQREKTSDLSFLTEKEAERLRWPCWRKRGRNGHGFLEEKGRADPHRLGEDKKTCETISFEKSGRNIDCGKKKRGASVQKPRQEIIKD